MANENKDVLRVTDVDASIDAALREKQIGFVTDTHSLKFKAPGGTVYEYYASGEDATFDNITLGGKIYIDADLDTYLWDNTLDDNISVFIAGNEDFNFTSNTFSVLPGSNIELDDSCRIYFDTSKNTSISYSGAGGNLAIDGDIQLDITASDIFLDVAGVDHVNLTSGTIILNPDSNDIDINYYDAASNLMFVADAGAKSFQINGSVVVNENGSDFDFRIESDTRTHALFVDGLYGCVGIGIDSSGYDESLFVKAKGTENNIFTVQETSGTNAITTLVEGAGGNGGIFTLYQSGTQKILLDANNTLIKTSGSIYIEERAAAQGDDSSYGQFWVKNDALLNPKFTDGVGNDFSLAMSDGTTGGSGSAGSGNQYVELNIGGTTYKVLHDGTV